MSAPKWTPRMKADRGMYEALVRTRKELASLSIRVIGADVKFRGMIQRIDAALAKAEGAE